VAAEFSSLSFFKFRQFGLCIFARSSLDELYLGLGIVHPKI